MDFVDVAQVARFAPVVTFASWEQYFPCSIDWLLIHSTLRDRVDPTFLRHRPNQFDLYRHWQSDGQHSYYVDVDRDVLVQRGQPIVGGQVVAPMYVTVQKCATFVEITYVMLYAHQGAQTFSALLPGRHFRCVVEDFGSHQGDLEWICVRTTTDLAHVLRVGFEAHGKVTFYRRGEYLSEADHPVVRVAMNGHACLPARPGDCALECVPSGTFGRILATVDVITANTESCVVWRPFDNPGGLVPFGFDAAGEPLGSQHWASFAGRLGGRTEYALKGATHLDGTRLNLTEWLYVKLLVTVARTGVLPRRFKSGTGPAGPGDVSRYFMRRVHPACVD